MTRWFPTSDVVQTGIHTFVGRDRNPVGIPAIVIEMPGTGNRRAMTNLSDDDMTSHEPTEQDDDNDRGGHGSQDTGDEPTEAIGGSRRRRRGRQRHRRRSLMSDPYPGSSVTSRGTVHR